MVRSLLLVAALLSAACSGSEVGTLDMGVDLRRAVDLSTPPDLRLPGRPATDHPAYDLVPNLGGPVLTSPEVWTVVWQGDEGLGERVLRFAATMLASEYWAASVGEYGVGAGRAMGVRVLPGPAPASLPDGDVRALIQARIADGTLPMPTANTLLAIVVPPSTQSTLFGEHGCFTYGGYHAEVTVGSAVVPYMINLQCDGTFDALTEVLSHEAAEAATDPRPLSHPAWVLDQAPLGGEISDLCAGLGAELVGPVDPDGGAVETYRVTRNWSNLAAQAGDRDPCVPAPATPWFNVAISPTRIEVDAPSQAIEVEAEYQPFAFGDVGSLDWRLRMPVGTGIKITPDHGTALPGETLRVTVRITGSAWPGLYPLVLDVRAQKGGRNQWVSTLVVN